MRVVKGQARDVVPSPQLASSLHFALPVLDFRSIANLSLVQDWLIHHQSPVIRRCIHNSSQPDACADVIGLINLEARYDWCLRSLDTTGIPQLCGRRSPVNFCRSRHPRWPKTDYAISVNCTPPTAKDQRCDGSEWFSGECSRQKASRRASSCSSLEFCAERRVT
jgi:hypothetical protein